MYGNYWDEDQIVVAQISDPNEIPFSIFKNQVGKPGILAVVIDSQNSFLIDYYTFVEIIPGTEHTDKYLDLLTGLYETCLCVVVNVYKSDKSMKFADMQLISTESWQLSWFKLKSVPSTSFDPVQAYNRAMGVIGG